MGVDLLLLAVLLEEAAENADALDPDVLGWHTGIGGTLSLTWRMKSVSKAIDIQDARSIITKALLLSFRYKSQPRMRQPLNSLFKKQNQKRNKQ